VKNPIQDTPQRLRLVSSSVNLCVLNKEYRCINLSPLAEPVLMNCLRMFYPHKPPLKNPLRQVLRFKEIITDNLPIKKLKSTESKATYYKIN
jgi:hypothetical protein